MTEYVNILTPPTTSWELSRIVNSPSIGAIFGIAMVSASGLSNGEKNGVEMYINEKYAGDSTYSVYEEPVNPYIEAVINLIAVKHEFAESLSEMYKFKHDSQKSLEPDIDAILSENTSELYIRD